MAKIRILGGFLFLSACIATPLSDPPLTPYIAPSEPETLAQAPSEFAFMKRHLDRIQARSIAENREYCGYLVITPIGNLDITPPQRGTVDSCTPPTPPNGFELIASYHTHAAYDYDFDSEIPSAEDLEGDMVEGVNGYVSTPGGRIWLNDVRAAETRLLCGLGCITSDPGFLPDPDYPVGNAYSLGALWARQN